MKLLLDSHVLLWAIDQPELLTKKVRRELLQEENSLHVSVCSVWEINLKVQSGKLKLPSEPDYLESNLRTLGISTYLSIGLFHVHVTNNLPAVHRDPFDRMLIAQAIAEKMVLVTKDQVFHEYPVEILW